MAWSMTGLSPQDLARILADPNAEMPAYSVDSLYAGTGIGQPTYVEGGIIPPIGVAGTKRNRGSQPNWDNQLTEPWGGSYDQTVYRNPVSTRVASNALPPALYGSTSAYVPLEGVTARDRASNGEYSEALTAATGLASASAAPVPRPRPFFPPTQMDEAIAIGKAYRPSPEVQAALAAPAPQEQRRAPVGGLLGLLLGGGERTGGGLMGLSGPERTNPNITYDQPLVHVPGTAGEVAGVDMAFMPQSVQQSSRWRTGY